MSIGAADLVKWPDGTPVPVEVEANASGNVAQRGDMVQVVDESDGVPVVRLTETRGEGVGILTRDPDDYDSGTNYATGDSAGRTELELVAPVYWVEPDAAYAAPSVGDRVTSAPGGGVDVVDGAVAAGQDGAVTNALGVAGDGTLENASAGDIEVDLGDVFAWGTVIMTNASDFGHGGKIAVAKGVN